MSTTAAPALGTHHAGWPTGWRGRWIGPAPEQPVVTTPGIGLAQVERRAGRHLFRTTFDLGVVPPAIPARVFADSRYLLLLNGHEVGRGPVRSQPRRPRYDTYDLVAAARAGRNVLVAVVTYYGTANAFWAPAPASGQLGVDAALVLEAHLGDRWLHTDGGWEVTRARAWSAAVSSGLDGVPVEVLDARDLPAGWRGDDESPAGSGTEWAPATVLHVEQLGAMGRSHPPMDPYDVLRSRPVGQLGGPTGTPVAISASPARPLLAEHEHPVDQVLVLLEADGDADQDGLALPLSWEARAGECRHVRLDMGRVVCGLVNLELVAPPGTRADLLYRERPLDADGWASLRGFTTPRTGARYTVRGDGDTFEAMEVNGLRWAHLVITAVVDGPVRLTRFAVRELLNRRGEGASFSSSDPELDELYRAGVRTVALNAQDAYTDCPTREQRAWVGDAVVHQMVDLTSSTDWRMAWWYLDLADSPRPDGILPMSVAGEVEHDGGQTIPDWSLDWVHGVYNLHRYSGDEERLAALLPTVERVLRWFEPCADASGVLADVPEWCLVDWSSLYLDGASSILTAMWARGLREFSEMAQRLGDTGRAAWARSRWDAARAGYEVFWDERRGCYVDQVIGGEQRSAASQTAGAMAIASGLAPQERWGRIIDRITDPERLVVRSWIGGGGTYDPARIAALVRGERTADWDVVEQVVAAEPFRCYVVHDALAAAGRHAELVTSMRRWSAFLTDGYDTFGECWDWGTPAHGWSSTPTRDLVQHILGVVPDQPGFATARVAPAFGLVDEMSAAVPTPAGLLHVRVEGSSVSVDSPLPFVVVGADGRSRSFPAGRGSVRG